MTKSRLSYLILILLIGFGVLELFLIVKQANKPASHSVSTQSSSSGGSSSGQPAFNKNSYPTDESSSLWVVVNKGRVLPGTYSPMNLTVPTIPLRLSPGAEDMHLRSDAAVALETMSKEAAAQDIKLMLASGYRSYSNQAATYSGFVKQSGQAAADTYSARPGHSEHQTGLAVDLEPASRKCELQDCFGETPEGKWLASNAYKYGFIIRYTKDNQKQTGYIYEPWHVRYVGKDLAAQINQTGQTLEQFFGLPAYPDYPPQSLQLK